MNKGTYLDNEHMHKDELKKCQRITDEAIKGYLNLIRQKELFEQSLKLASSIKNAVSSNKALLSIMTIQDTLYCYLVVELHSWLFDKDESLGMRQLLKKLKNEHSVKFLRQYRTRIPKAVSLDEKDHSQFHLSHVKHLETEFDKNIKKCICTYEKLLDSELFKRFDLLRRKHLVSQG